MSSAPGVYACTRQWYRVTMISGIAASDFVRLALSISLIPIPSIGLQSTPSLLHGVSVENSAQLIGRGDPRWHQLLATPIGRLRQSADFMTSVSGDNIELKDDGLAIHYDRIRLPLLGRAERAAIGFGRSPRTGSDRITPYRADLRPLDAILREASSQARSGDGSLVTKAVSQMVVFVTSYCTARQQQRIQCHGEAETVESQRVRNISPLPSRSNESSAQTADLSSMTGSLRPSKHYQAERVPGRPRRSIVTRDSRLTLGMSAGRECREGLA